MNKIDKAIDTFCKLAADADAEWIKNVPVNDEELLLPTENEPATEGQKAYEELMRAENEKVQLPIPEDESEDGLPGLIEFTREEISLLSDYLGEIRTPENTEDQALLETIRAKIEEAYHDFRR